MVDKSNRENRKLTLIRHELIATITESVREEENVHFTGRWEYLEHGQRKWKEQGLWGIEPQLKLVPELIVLIQQWLKREENPDQL